MDSMTPQLLHTVMGVRGGAGVPLAVVPEPELAAEAGRALCTVFFGAGAGAGAASGVGAAAAGTGAGAVAEFGAASGAAGAGAGGDWLQAARAVRTPATHASRTSMATGKFRLIMLSNSIAAGLAVQSTVTEHGRKIRRRLCRQLQTLLRSFDR
jgi:hypothetical protein